MSKRVMNILRSCSQKIEIYSIDEAFLSLDHNLYTDPASLSKYAAHMRHTVMKWTGIPVSIGIGPTKTLSKLANAVAKKNPDAHGVCNFIDNPHRDKFMKSIPVVKIWGVGRRNAVKLNLHGIYTVYDFTRASENWLRENLTIAGYRTHQELNGISCINLTDITPPRKTIISSRSFCEPVTTLQPLREAIASYVSIAAQKLRKQHSTASVILVFITTKHYGNGPHYSQSTVQALHPASSYTPLLIKNALKLLSAIYKPGYRYKKAGVVLSGIHSTRSSQLDLFCPRGPHEETVMSTIDMINTQWGNGTIKTASEGIEPTPSA